MADSFETYEQAVDGLKEFGTALEEILRSILRDKTSVVLHSLPWRIKEKPSADLKMARSPGEYDSYNSIHDLLGMRVITLFESDIPAVHEVLHKVLKVDAKRSVDKSASFRPNEFGYRSQHYIGTISKQRARLPENAKFANRLVEVQVRSVLQHAWAEVEHDLGYKPQRPISTDVRRKFSRLAALTELIDESYSDLRRSLESVETAALAEAPNSLRSSTLTAASLMALVRKEPEFTAFEQRIAAAMHLHVKPEQDEARERIGFLLDQCTAAGWTSTGDIMVALNLNRGRIIAQAGELSEREIALLEFPPGNGLRPGFSIGLLTQTALEGGES